MQHLGPGFLAAFSRCKDDMFSEKFHPIIQCLSINGLFALTLRCFINFCPRNINYIPVVKIY
jgi:hypothetical protein